MTDQNSPAGIDRQVLETRVRRLSGVLNAHAGGLEVVDIGRDGRVAVRFTGMCRGCPLRPVSFEGLVKPALSSVEGVAGVVAQGGRMSSEAERRMAHQVRQLGNQCLLNAVEGPADEEEDHDSSR